MLPRSQRVLRPTIIVPVKSPSIGKSRLRRSVPVVNRLDSLVEAIALDTIAAACAIDADVMVVTAAETIAAEAATLGAKVIADPAADLGHPGGGNFDTANFDTANPRGDNLDGADGGNSGGGSSRGYRIGSESGLNAAIRHAEAAIGHDRARVAMTADLPALRPDELRDALAAAARAGRSFVADHHGIGTTLLSAPAGVPLNPIFGGASALAHAASGAAKLSGAWPGLRLDVDDAADLQAARALGLGARTRRHIVINDKPTTSP